MNTSFHYFLICPDLIFLAKRRLKTLICPSSHMAPLWSSSFRGAELFDANPASSSQEWLMILICLELLVAEAKGFSWLPISQSLYLNSLVPSPHLQATWPMLLTCHLSSSFQDLTPNIHTTFSLKKPLSSAENTLAQDAQRSFGYLILRSV